ncbi:hypothetical protein N7533_011350 [Penicillium manginii]|jgi:ubiquitin-protein ligase|uniref:uncharacterized protein n=1 Tax=Penicillium manginii TaxID=203109 RepID=UPI0025477D1F|nr:uncharacterized protein N7533_011350 [Penicillium manginii]KAJ5741941.1 hypothetical protein N7533_011350 [Penicillium manginii]
MALRDLLRVHKEIEDVNADFHSLRTVLRNTRNKSKWNFVMFPNDGALSHLPLIGELIIPEDYPDCPPVLHLFTRTLRYNVDVYRSHLTNDNHSTMCFDILSSKSRGGTWENDYTISCLFASLMQALVTQRVPQTYGPDKPEFVTMDKLNEIKKTVHDTYRSYKNRFPHLPTIPMIHAVSVAAMPFIFTRLDNETPLDSLHFQADDKYVSQPIYLQDLQNEQSWSTALDLRNLHPGVVFSVILSNKRGVDVVGKKNDTILIRNGVTGTAAKKRANEPISWFYHGKPLNDQNLSVCVTVTSDQFVISYKDDDTNTFIVHGDTPISKLGKAQIGDVAGMPFYLTILLKRKTGAEGFINVLDQKQVGFIHANQIGTPMTIRSKYPASVSLTLDNEQTARLQGVIDFYGLGLDFQVQKNVLSPAKHTLISSTEFPKERYMNAIDEMYTPLRDKVVEMNVTAIIADKDCVALLTDTHRCLEDQAELPSLPERRLSTLIMRLRNNTVMPNCVDELLGRVSEDPQKDWIHVGDVHIKLPQPIKVVCRLKFEF